MRLFFLGLFMLLNAAVYAATITDYTMTPSAAEKPIIAIILYNQPGVPDGWIDSTTRPDATDICNHMIATQSKFYANAISKSRCLVKVQE
jgi:hypothetical protein